ncbi:VanZ family protein [Streptomyces sp. NBC_00144]|uniref:VanZ family protein n=1 Tax=Streptomyces sp. NBC_00144 TaxID=2975665 RepID=UPI003251E7B7
MVSVYLLPVKTAAALFPLLALVLFLPTAVVLYRRHGVMSQWRVMSLLGFLYYAISALCMTIVPLPKETQGMCRRFAAVAHPQWIPGNTFGDIWKDAHHKVSLGALVFHNPAVAGALLNLVMLLPLGAFVRYHLRRGIAAAAVAGFGASLFFEITQGTALWGIYPCPYRLFDVDDLLINAAGALVGWCVAGPLARVLPTLDTPEERVGERRLVPVGQRLVALLADLAGAAAVIAAAVLALMYAGQQGSEVLPPVMAVALPAYFVVVPWLTGVTPGKRLLLLRLVPVGEDGKPALWRLVVRAVLLGVVALPLVATFVAASLVLLDRPMGLLRQVTQAGVHDVYWLLIGHFPQILLATFVCGWVGAYVLLARRRAPQLWFHELASGVRTVASPRARTSTRSEHPDGLQVTEPDDTTGRPDADSTRLPNPRTGRPAPAAEEEPTPESARRS